MTENTPTIQPDIIKAESETVINLNKEERDAAFHKELAAIRNKSDAQSVTDSDQLTGKTSETLIEQAAESEPITTSQSETSIEINSDDDELSNKPIPKKRLDKEISKRQELEFKLQEERDARIKYETELRVFNDALYKLNAQKEPELDPIDNDAHNFYMKKIQELEKKIEEKTSVLEKNNLQNRFESTVNNQAAEFSKKHTDFQNAYQYVLDKEKQNARLFGVPENQLDAFVAEKLQPIASHVYNSGGNVAETVYNMAKNYGYNATKGTGNNVNLKAIEKNMAKSQSIIDEVPASSVGIKSSGSIHSATELSNFNEIMEKAGDKKDQVFRKLLNEIRNG